MEKGTTIKHWALAVSLVILGGGMSACSGGSTKWKRICLMILCGLVLPVVAQAASFDCVKAQSQVEKQICGNGKLSRLDDELANIYAGALKLSGDKNQLVKQQRDWLKARNRKCTNPLGTNSYGEEVCLIHSYQGRIKALIKAHKELDGYTVLMSKDNELCNHMLKSFTEDLQHDSRGTNLHEEFYAVPWKPAKYSYEYHGKLEYQNVEGALFDFNNDGVLDFVVRFRGMLSSMPADAIAVFGAEMAKRANELTAKEFYGASNYIHIAGSFYDLSGPLKGGSESLWRLSPFIYRGTSYLFMQSVYEPVDYKGPSQDEMVISKYVGGRFEDREMTGKMEDICYFKRFGAVR
jgi:uncharacterized protein